MLPKLVVFSPVKLTRDVIFRVECASNTTEKFKKIISGYVLHSTEAVS